MMNDIKHKIGEAYTAVRAAQGTEQEVSIRRINDGYWFNFISGAFENYQATSDNSYRSVFETVNDNPEFVKVDINNLPDIPFEAVFVYKDINVDGQGTDVKEYERHVFGGRILADEPNTCKIFGTLRDVSNKPLAGQKVEAYLNRAGFFTHKAGLIGYSATVLTDESGYFELPLIQGLDVTISVPIIGFTQRGFVPTISAVELSTQTLLSYAPDTTN
jgi:hypothetical protein